MTRLLSFLVLTTALSGVVAHASASDLDDAKAALGTTYEMQCVRNGGGDLGVDWEAMDLNHDGRPEYLATVDGTGNGTSGCFGHAGANIHLMIRSASGEWEKSFDFPAIGVRRIERGDGKWDDLEIAGPGFCFPIWRYQGGEYGIWKTCEGGKLVYAEGIRDGAVPSGETASQPRRRASSSISNEVISLRSISGQGMSFNHNGSQMLVVAEKGLIVYEIPKASIAGTVKPGTVLFRGTPWNDETDGAPIRGVARVFKKGCAPAPYEVTGRFDAYGFTLSGASPVRSKSSCAVTGMNPSSPNATLRFQETWGDS